MTSTDQQQWIADNAARIIDAFRPNCARLPILADVWRFENRLPNPIDAGSSLVVDAMNQNESLSHSESFVDNQGVTQTD